MFLYTWFTTFVVIKRIQNIFLHFMQKEKIKACIDSRGPVTQGVGIYYLISTN